MNHHQFGTKTAIIALFAAFSSTTAIAADIEVTVTNLTRGMHFTPLILAAHSPDVHMFAAGSTASSQLQAIAEGGDTNAMAALLESIGASVANGDGLVAPGGTATFMLDSASDSVFSLAGMLLPTNDGFVGLNSAWLPADGEQVVYNALGYDAGTEANDEIVGSGAPGETGFPAPPPVVATGTGTGGTGVHTAVEGFVHVHRNVLGDLDATGGASDINAAVHRWLNPVARITIKNLNGASSGGVSLVSGLNGITYSSTALELFWQPATSAESYVTGYEIRRNGQILDTINGTSYFEQGLDAGVEYSYEVTAIDAAGDTGQAASVSVTTNAQ